jgi:2'-5' RNA ligase
LLDHGRRQIQASARLFVAVELPEDVREELAAWARRALGGERDVRLLPAESLHLTLCFIGERPVADIDLVAQLALEPTRPLPGMALDGMVGLPLRRPRVLAVRIADPDGELGRLQADVVHALEQVGHPAERRRYRPHVTVARIRGQRPSRLVGVAEPVPSLTFDGDALTLFRSRLEPSGARYEALASVPLAQS